MTSEKSIHNYKTVLRSVLKAELQLLLKRLADNGEESIVLLATSGSLQSSPAICTKLGGEFFKKESTILNQIGKKFQSYCQGQKGPQAQVVRDSNSDRKRKLSSSGDEDLQDYTEMEEVIVYVTEPDSGSSEARVKSNEVTSSAGVTSEVNGEPVYSEANSEDLPQLTVPSQSHSAAAADSDSQLDTEVVIIAEHSDDQSKTLWTDYLPSNSSEAGATSSTGDQETDTQEIISTSVDVAGSPQAGGQGIRAPHTTLIAGVQKEQDILQIAVSDSIGVRTDRALGRNEDTDRFMALPISLPKPAASSSKHGMSHTTKPGQSKQASGTSSDRVKQPMASPFSTYLSRMSGGQSVMIRAGEDSFEEIQTICVPETEPDNVRPEKKPKRVQKKVEKTGLSPVPGGVMAAVGEAEMVITEMGETVHVLKAATEEEEKFDIPFEECFELLGKSARCLVCGKIMLKRNRRYHWRFHTGHKPFTCEYCLKQFYHPSNLKTHKFIHTARNR